MQYNFRIIYSFFVKEPGKGKSADDEQRSDKPDSFKDESVVLTIRPNATTQHHVGNQAGDTAGDSAKSASNLAVRTTKDPTSSGVGLPEGKLNENNGQFGNRVKGKIFLLPFPTEKNVFFTPIIISLNYI